MRLYPAAKRLLDLGCALAGLLVLSPVLAAAAAAVWLEDGHWPLFGGRRIARGGGEFRMLKLRTMIPGAWKTGVASTAAGDGRITRAGALLRAAKLDEFPQLWNVVAGQMSLVGPRPQVAADAALYTAEERRLLTVRPGITDLASIVFADEGRILAGSPDPDLLYNQLIRPWKSRLALLGMERASLAADLRILGLTLVSALNREAALEGVARLLQAWGADPLLQRMAARRELLVAYPPPGAEEVVRHYPRAAGAAAAGGPASIDPAAAQPAAADAPPSRAPGAVR